MLIVSRCGDFFNSFSFCAVKNVNKRLKMQGVCAKLLAFFINFDYNDN